VAPAERLDLRLCGGLRVSCGDEHLALSRTARQGRLVLAYLALHRGRAVGRAELMAHVWTEPDPVRVAASLSQTLSRLRQILGRDRLERLASGAVRLTGPVRIDVEHARETLAESRLAVARGRWKEASAAAQDALSELAGEVLAGDEAAWLDDVRREVADLRVDALELRAHAALQLRAWADAVAAARGAVETSATRESAWALLIEAQAARGDVALATETFHEIKARLIESGLTPGPELVEVNRRLVAGELTSDTPAGAAFPAALAVEGDGGGFVGRAAILRQLRMRYRQAAAGVRQLVLLCGEPGIGKTRLAGELAREAHADGAVVLYGRSDEETLVPYQPFVTAIGHYLADSPKGALARERAPELSELSRLLPDLGWRMPEIREPLAVEPEMRRYRLFTAVASVLAFIARERPVVLILDDLQWSDQSTALLLQHTIHEIRNARLLVLGTLRDVEACRSPGLADFLARPAPHYERVSLLGLDASETAAFVTLRRGRGATDDGVGALLADTGGNPLLLAETLKSVAESHSPADAITAPALRRAGVPSRVKQVLARRVARLSEPAQRVLADASVIGVGFDVRVLELMGPDRERVLGALEEAEAAGLLREVPDAIDRYEFSHALVRETLREGQSGARRRRLHHRIGEALEALSGTSAAHPAEIAHHFSESREPGDAQKALEYSLLAGDRAAQSLAHEDAAGHYRRALRLLAPGDEPRRCEVLLALGRVQLRQGSSEARKTFLHASELAERNGLVEQLGRAALGVASRYTEAGVVDNEGIALLRAARAALGDRPTLLAVRLTARLADSLHFAPDPGEAEQLSRHALELARALGDPRSLAAALECRHAALLSVEHLEERLRLSRELVELAQQVSERELEALGRHWRIYDLLEAGRVEEARGECAMLAALARELRQPLYEHFAVGWEVVWALMAGQVGDVEPLAQRFYELGIQAQARDTETIHRAQLIALRRRQELLAEFVTTVQSAVEANPTLLAWRAVLPLAHLASGDPAAAVAEFGWFAQEGFSRVRRDMFWLTTMCVLAETCALLRDGASAAALYEQLKPFEHCNVQVTQAACWGSTERFLGLLAAVVGRWDTAAAHLESAIAKNEAGANPAAAALVRRDLAKLLMARQGAGDLDRAVELLREPLRVARESGTPSLIGRIQAEVDAVDRARRAALSG
jgi:DNA-binding SARP family transcriptional activator